MGKLGEIDFPVIGTIGYHEKIEAECLQKYRLNAQTATDELNPIIDDLLKGSNPFPNKGLDI